MKYHATVQSAREQYISRHREEILNNFLRTAVKLFTHGLNRGVMLHIQPHDIMMQEACQGLLI